MKKKITLFVSMVFCLALNSQGQTYNVESDNKPRQVVKKKLPPANTLGLWDANITVGHLSSTDNKYVNNAPSENINTTGNYFMLHIQESILNNYIWSGAYNKKIKIGFQETLDFGYKMSSAVHTFPGGGVPDNAKGNNILFGYEAGLGFLYRIDDNIDAGFTYNFLTFSPFISNGHGQYLKLRLRYKHLLAEVAAFGKVQFELKYMFGFSEHSFARNFYLGVCYIGFSDNSKNNIYSDNVSSRFLHANFGLNF